MQNFICLLIGYLCGSIPTGIWYAKLVHQMDVRTVGSGNSGATNVGRTFGLKAAVLVAVVDILKAWIPLTIGHYLFQLPAIAWVSMALGAVIGHAYPIFANFRGGKVVATAGGVLLAYSLPLTLVFLALFAFILYFTSTVSVASMSSYLLISLRIWIGDSTIYGIGFMLITLLLFYRHRSNLKRLINGNESIISWGRVYNKRRSNHS